MNLKEQGEVCGKVWREGRKDRSNIKIVFEKLHFIYFVNLL